MTRPARALAAAAVAVSGWAALAATVLPPGDPVRVAAIAGFVLCGPGLAVAGLRRGVGRPAGRRAARRPGARARRDPLEEAVEAVATGCALCAIVSAALLLTGVFTATRVLTVLAGLTTATVVLTPPARTPGAGREEERA